MSFKTVAGGYQLTSEDEKILLEQRSITKAINEGFVQVGALFLKQSSKNPYQDDWFKRQYKDTDLQRWIDDPELRGHNAGFNLQLGWMDVDIDAEDPEFNRAVIAAMNHLHIDTRFAFGRLSVGHPSHVLLQLGEEESANFATLTRFEPRPFKIDDKRYHVQLRSFPTNIKEANLAKAAKQTVVPGSIYTHKTKAGAYDISVWYANGSHARKVQQIATTTPRKVNFREVVRAIAFATVAYVVKDQWVEGSRQSTAQKVGGWLARVVKESQSMNNNESISEEVFCPIDDHGVAESLLYFVCDYLHDDEKHMRVRVYEDAVEKLDRNPDAKIPGWPAMETLFGPYRISALRAVLMPGSDVSSLTKMAERYVYDEDDDKYIDRERFFTAGKFLHESKELERRHKSDTVKVGGKSREAFKVFEASTIRKRIGMRDLYPNLAPGSINRISSIGEILSDDDESDKTALTVFNTWRGWPVDPTPDSQVDIALMKDIVSKLDKVLGLLTRDNEDQMEWAKQWVAWTFQKPGTKQQIAWVVVGEQGIGKSWFGNVWMNSMIGDGLWGAASPSVLDGQFSVEPFINKMFTFIDEAKFHSEQSVEEIKKLIRSVKVPGVEKFSSARTYNIYSRIMFASNRLDIGVGQANVQDRALFFTHAYDREHLKMTEPQFRTWAEGLKPFFDEFTGLMNKRVVREHFMRYFMEMETDRHKIESIKFSSSGDAKLVVSNMSWPRRIAKHIIEDGRIFEDMDISWPFFVTDLNKRVYEVGLELGLRNVQGSRVLAEFESAGVIEKFVTNGQRKLRFTHKIGSLTQIFSEAINAPLDSRFEFTDKDFGQNDCDGTKPIPWKGNKRGVVAEAKDLF